jgi:hypothetical protein
MTLTIDNELPERINAIKSITYDVQQIVEALMAEQEIEADSVTLEMVMDRIESWVEEDFANDVADNIGYQDENGSEVNA